MTVSILGINIKKTREAKGMSAYRLAKEAHVSASTISEIESGIRQSLNTSTVEKVANVLGISTDELFSTENNVEYVVTDIEQTINLILSSDELVLDDILLSTEEKNQIKITTQIALNSIREMRQALGRVHRAKDVEVQD